MTRSELERYLGKCVTITLLDDTVIEGDLHKTGEKAFENDPNLSIPVNFYFCTDVNNKVIKKTVFRVSHIKKIRYQCQSIESGKRQTVDCQCPNCNALTKEGKPNFCWNCGQKLDWSENNV